MDSKPSNNDSSNIANQRHSSPQVDITTRNNFMMHIFKTYPCAKSEDHDWILCPGYHPNDGMRRRNPSLHQYSLNLCPNTQGSRICLEGDSCKLAHNWWEICFHPSNYRTMPCRYGPNCPMKVCCFAHSPEELRVPTNSGYAETRLLAPQETPIVQPRKAGKVDISVRDTLLEPHLMHQNIKPGDEVNSSMQSRNVQANAGIESHLSQDFSLFAYQPPRIPFLNQSSQFTTQPDLLWNQSSMPQPSLSQNQTFHPQIHLPQYQPNQLQPSLPFYSRSQSQLPLQSNHSYHPRKTFEMNQRFQHQPMFIPGQSFVPQSHLSQNQSRQPGLLHMQEKHHYKPESSLSSSQGFFTQSPVAPNQSSMDQPPLSQNKASQTQSHLPITEHYQPQFNQSSQPQLPLQTNQPQSHVPQDQHSQPRLSFVPGENTEDWPLLNQSNKSKVHPKSGKEK